MRPVSSCFVPIDYFEPSCAILSSLGYTDKFMLSINATYTDLNHRTVHSNGVTIQHLDTRLLWALWELKLISDDPVDYDF